MLPPPCTYCGQVADTKDHLESRSWTGHKGYFWRGQWVWACFECNSLLSDKRIPDPEDRRRFIAKRLMDRYYHKAKRPLGSTEGLEGSLLAYVEDQNLKLDLLRSRLCEASGFDLFANPHPE